MLSGANTGILPCFSLWSLAAGEERWVDLRKCGGKEGKTGSSLCKRNFKRNKLSKKRDFKD